MHFVLWQTFFISVVHLFFFCLFLFSLFLFDHDLLPYSNWIHFLVILILNSFSKWCCFHLITIRRRMYEFSQNYSIWLKKKCWIKVRLLYILTISDVCLCIVKGVIPEGWRNQFQSFHEQELFCFSFVNLTKNWILATVHECSCRIIQWFKDGKLKNFIFRPLQKIWVFVSYWRKNQLCQIKPFE